MIRFLVVLVVTVGWTATPAVAARHHQQRRGGNPEVAVEVLASRHLKNSNRPDDFDVTVDDSTSSTRSLLYDTSSITDFQLACDNQRQVEEILFGSEYAQYADCTCSLPDMSILCNYGGPSYSDDGSYSVQEHYTWNFYADSGQFSFVDQCFWCHEGACLDDATVYDSYCHAVDFDGRQEAMSCAVTMGSAAKDCGWIVDCQVCTTSEGWFGVAPTSTGCFYFPDGSECVGGPYLYNPFNKTSDTEINKAPSTKSGAIVGSIFGVIFVIVIGVGVYYCLHNGKCPKLPWCKNCQGLHYAKRDVATLTEKKLNMTTTNDSSTHEDKCWSDLLRERRFLEPFKHDAGKVLGSIRMAANSIDLADPVSLGTFLRTQTPRDVPNAFLTRDSETSHPIVIHNVQLASTCKPGEQPNVYAFWGVETDTDPFWLKSTQVAKLFHKATHVIPHMDKLLDLGNLDNDSFAAIALINEVDPGPGVMLADGVSPAQDANKMYDESHEITQATYLHPKIAAALMDYLDLHPDAKAKDLFTVVKAACEKPKQDSATDATTFETQWVLETLRFLWVMCNTGVAIEGLDFAAARDRSEAMQVKKTTLDTYFKKTVTKSPPLTNKNVTGGTRDSNDNTDELLRRQVKASEREARFQSFAVVSDAALSLYSMIKPVQEREPAESMEQPDDTQGTTMEELEANARSVCQVVETTKQLHEGYKNLRSLFPKKNTEKEKESDGTEPADQEREV